MATLPTLRPPQLGPGRASRQKDVEPVSFLAADMEPKRTPPDLPHPLAWRGDAA